MLREEFGWSKTMLSAAFAMERAESGILGPVQGWLTDGGLAGRVIEIRPTLEDVFLAVAGRDEP